MQKSGDFWQGGEYLARGGGGGGGVTLVSIFVQQSFEYIKVSLCMLSVLSYSILKMCQRYSIVGLE